MVMYKTIVIMVTLDSVLNMIRYSDCRADMISPRIPSRHMQYVYTVCLRCT